MSPKDLFVCPKCRRALRLDGAEARCACGATWPLDDGVLDLLPAPPERRSPAQALMESEPLVRIYESRLWRRSPLLVVPFGISFDRERDLILSEARLRPDAAILDLACGPGIYSRAFARQAPAGVVVGLDLSRPMLRTAAKLARGEGIGNVAFVRANALDLPFEAERFDAVNCCGALHLFPDVPRALGEVRRVLKPGGRFTTAVVRTYGGWLGERLGEISRRATGLRPFTDTGIQDLVRGAGLADVRVAHSKRSWLIASASKP